MEGKQLWYKDEKYAVAWCLGVICTPKPSKITLRSDVNVNFKHKIAFSQISIIPMTLYQGIMQVNTYAWLYSEYTAVFPEKMDAPKIPNCQFWGPSF